MSTTPFTIKLSDSWELDNIGFQLQYYNKNIIVIIIISVSTHNNCMPHELILNIYNLPGTDSESLESYLYRLDASISILTVFFIL